jgi:hypothetical protein
LLFFDLRHGFVQFFEIVYAVIDSLETDITANKLQFAYFLFVRCLLTLQVLFKILLLVDAPVRPNEVLLWIASHLKRVELSCCHDGYGG